MATNTESSRDVFHVFQFDIRAALVFSGSLVLEEDDIVDFGSHLFPKVITYILGGSSHDKLVDKHSSLIFGEIVFRSRQLFGSIFTILLFIGAIITIRRH